MEGTAACSQERIMAQVSREGEAAEGGGGGEGEEAAAW